MEQCRCKEIKEFTNIEDTPFILVPKREMVCPQKYYMMCQNCHCIIPYIFENNIYKCIINKKEE